MSALGWGIIGVLLLGLLFARPIRSRVRRYRRNAERVRLEDGLKHLLTCERGGRACTLENMAGRLEITRGTASDILTRLTDRGLAVHAASGFVLTEPGRAYALRILRSHRLWERYLADRTGLPAGEWHTEAERAEHRMTEEDAERLAARLGHPRYDPHGDPIPTAGGDIPAPAGIPLTRLDPGEAALVVHVEDEPPEVFARLSAAGLAPGVVLEVLEPAGDGAAGDAAPAGSRLRIRVEGRDVALSAVEAGNVTVEQAEATGPLDRLGSPARTLASAEPGETVQVLGISRSCQGPQRRRLLDLGVVPGTRITPEFRSAAGDPVAYRIRGALIALRREQARWVEVADHSVEQAS